MKNFSPKDQPAVCCAVHRTAASAQWPILLQRDVYGLLLVTNIEVHGSLCSSRSAFSCQSRSSSSWRSEVVPRNFLSCELRWMDFLPTLWNQELEFVNDWNIETIFSAGRHRGFSVLPNGGFLTFYCQSKPVPGVCNILVFYVPLSCVRSLI